MKKLEIDRDFIEREKRSFNSLRVVLFDRLDGDDVGDVMAAHNMMKSIFCFVEFIGELKSRFLTTGAMLQERGLFQEGAKLEHPVFKGHCEGGCDHEDEGTRDSHNDTLKTMKELLELLKK